MLIGNNTLSFQSITNVNNEYQYTIDISVNEYRESSIDIEYDNFMTWFQIKTSNIGNYTIDNYSLFVM